MSKKKQTDIERFWTHVEPQESGCWLWTAAAMRGYPVFKVYPKMVRAHRFIWKHQSLRRKTFTIPATILFA